MQGDGEADHRVDAVGVDREGIAEQLRRGRETSGAAKGLAGVVEELPVAAGAARRGESIEGAALDAFDAIAVGATQRRALGRE